jgi:hypothetical protein
MRNKKVCEIITLKNAIQEGLNSQRVEIFDFDDNLKKLKEEKWQKLSSIKKTI